MIQYIIPLIVIVSMIIIPLIIIVSILCYKRAYAKNADEAAAGFANLPQTKAMTTEQGLACVGFSSSEMPSSLAAYLSEEEFKKRV